jgi:hypothetical protein
MEQEDDHVCIPGQIVFFLEVTKEMVGIDVGGEMILPSTGLFDLILSQEDPLPHPGKRSELVVKGSKCLTTKYVRQTSTWFLLNPLMNQYPESLT